MGRGRLAPRLRRARARRRRAREPAIGLRAAAASPAGAVETTSAPPATPYVGRGPGSARSVKPSVPRRGRTGRAAAGQVGERALQPRDRLARAPASAVRGGERRSPARPRRTAAPLIAALAGERREQVASSRGRRRRRSVADAASTAPRRAPAWRAPLDAAARRRRGRRCRAGTRSGSGARTPAAPASPAVRRRARDAQRRRPRCGRGADAVEPRRVDQRAEPPRGPARREQPRRPGRREGVERAARAGLGGRLEEASCRQRGAPGRRRVDRGADGAPPARHQDPAGEGGGVGPQAQHATPWCEPAGRGAEPLQQRVGGAAVGRRDGEQQRVRPPAGRRRPRRRSTATSRA